MTHKLKTLPIYFNKVWEKEKQFEIRKNDRGFKTGDKLILEEWSDINGYTHRFIDCTVKYVLHGFEGLTEGYVALSIEINNCVS